MRLFWYLVFGYLVLFVSWNLFLGSSRVLATSQFKTSISITYIYDSSGIPVVNQKLSLTNLTSENYLASYQFTIHGENIHQVYGRDSLGPLKISTTVDDTNSTLVTVNFNDQVVGLGKTLEFSLDYQGQPATRNGQVWQITIPSLTTPQVFDNYQLSLTVPESFGTAASLNPNPQSSEANTYIYNTLESSVVPIQGAFGNFQSFDFTFTYPLQNSSLGTQLIEVPIPPDTPYQHVVLTSLNPEPVNVREDEDGNWLAQYKLTAGKNLTIIASGHAYIQPVPAFSTITESSVNLAILKRSVPNWLTDGPEISNLASQYSTPNQIFSYVQSTTAKKSSLFVSIARAAGIPSRETYGFRYPENGFVSWPQYWNTEIQNWSNLGFDVNQLAFYTNGTSLHNFPLPQVTIIQAPYANPLRSPATFYWKKPFQFLPITTTTSSLEIQNSSGQAIYNLPVSVAAQNMILQPPGTTIITTLPPYSHVSFPVIFMGSLLPDFSAKYLAVSVDSHQLTYNISNNLFIFWHATITIAFSIIIIIVAFIATKAWSLYFQRPRKNHHLRR